jgi:pimeloyl-ACP methyl ester carboxylesterase
MAYVEVGEGDPIVLLHGNPTSSYLWRNDEGDTHTYIQGLGQCVKVAAVFDEAIRARGHCIQSGRHKRLLIDDKLFRCGNKARTAVFNRE